MRKFLFILPLVALVGCSGVQEAPAPNPACAEALDAADVVIEAYMEGVGSFKAVMDNIPSAVIGGAADIQNLTESIKASTETLQKSKKAVDGANYEELKIECLTSSR